jgi:tetrahydromethanopterin S-methyltransferase subunit F
MADEIRKESISPEEAELMKFYPQLFRELKEPDFSRIKQLASELSNVFKEFDKLKELEKPDFDKIKQLVESITKEFDKFGEVKKPNLDKIKQLVESITKEFDKFGEVKKPNLDKIKRLVESITKEFDKFGEVKELEASTIGGRAEKEDKAKKASKEYAESIRELEYAFKGAHDAFKVLFKLMEDKGFKEALKDSVELRRMIQNVTRDVEYLKRATIDFENIMKRLGEALVAPASEFNRELDRSLGYFGGIKRVVEDVGETFRQKIIERVKEARATGEIGATGEKTALGFLAALPVAGAIIGMGMWGRTLEERYRVMGRQITSILETVSNATEKNVRIWLQAGSIFGSELTGMAEAWKKLPEEIKGYAEAMTKAFAVAIDVSHKTGRAVAETIKDITEMGMTLTMKFGMSIGEVANKINELGRAWGRTTQLAGIVERWFGVLSGRTRDLALRSDEFAGVVDKMRAQFGLLGLSMENSARIANVLGDAFKKNSAFLKEYGVEGVSRMIEGFAGFENRLKSNIGTFLFFSDALEKPLAGLDDLWDRTVRMGEAYRSGGVFGLAINAFERMSRMIGEPGAKLWVAQQMGLSIDQYSVFDKFIGEFRRIGRGNEEIEKLMAQYLQRGEREVLEQLGKRGVKIEDMEKLRKDVKGLSEALTDPMRRIEIAIRDAVFHLAEIMAGLLKIIIGLLTGIFFGVTFQPSKAWEAFKYGFEGVNKIVDSIGKFAESVAKAGVETGDVLLGLGDLFERLKKLGGDGKKTPEQIQAERIAEFKSLLEAGRLVPVRKVVKSEYHRITEEERGNIIQELKTVTPSDIEYIGYEGGQIVIRLNAVIEGAKAFILGKADLNQRSTAVK